MTQKLPPILSEDEGENDNNTPGAIVRDLSSAKRELNSRAAVLQETLRGCATRRVLDMGKRRDSLAAKKQTNDLSAVAVRARRNSARLVVHHEVKENINNISNNNNENETSLTKLRPIRRSRRIREKSMSGESVKSWRSDGNYRENAEPLDPYQPFVARKIPSGLFNKPSKGILTVQKRPTTRSLEPTVGKFRDTSELQRKSKRIVVQSKKTGDGCENPYIPFQARPLPLNRKIIDKNEKQIIKSMQSQVVTKKKKSQKTTRRVTESLRKITRTRSSRLSISSA